MTEKQFKKNSAKEISNRNVTDSSKVNKKEKIADIRRSFRKFLFTIIMILLTATITWYVNYRLNYLDPVISIANIEFFYDLENQKDLIEIPVSLLEIDSRGFFGRNLKHFMQLDELQDFTKMERPIEIEKRYDLYEQELEIFLRFLSESSPDHSLMSQYALDFLRSGAFSGIAGFLVFLEEENLVEPLSGTSEKINKLKDDSGKIKVADNSYFFTDAWSREAKTANQRFMAKKIEWFAARVIYNLVERNFQELKEYFSKCKMQMADIRKHDIEAEKQVLTVIEEKAKRYKKTKMIFQIVNRSDFPLLIFPYCEILFSKIDNKEKFRVKGQLEELDKSGSESSPINLFKAIIVGSKSSQEFLVKSVEIPERALDEIKTSFEANNLQSKISVYMKRHKDKEEKYDSDWIILRENGL
jgi:hypothetical protein